MEQILNFLPLTEEERAAFEAAAPGVPQIFRPVESTRFVPAAPAEEYATATVILGCAPVAAVAGAGRLKWLQTWSAGVDPYLKPGVLREGAALTSAVGAYGQAVSEHMFAMLLALCKRLHQYRDTQSRGCWAPLGEVRTLAGATVLVAGTGISVPPLHCWQREWADTVGLRRTPSRAAVGIDGNHPLSALDQWLPRADVVALALPHSPETEHLMDRRRIQAMKRDAILLNAGRGTAVDCMARRRLWRKAISGARGWTSPIRSPCRRASALACGKLPDHAPCGWRGPSPGHPGAGGADRAGKPAPLSGRRSAAKPDEIENCPPFLPKGGQFVL